MSKTAADQPAPATSRARRIIQSGIAGLLGNLGTIALQLVTVPLLLVAWGTHLFGEWLIVSTVLGYVTLSDLGVTTVAHNRIDAAMGAGDARRATATFRSSLLLLALFTLLICGAFLVFALTQRESLLALFSAMTASEASETFLVLLLDGALMIVFVHGANLLRSVRRNPETQYRVSVARLLGLAAIPVSALLGASPFVAALAMLAIHAANFGFLLIRLRRIITWLVPGVGIDLAEARTLVKLASSYLLLPISNIVYLQLSIFLIAAWAGPQVVALYVSLRTLTRMITQFVPMVGAAVWSEVAHSAGREDRAAIGSMARLVLMVAPAATLVLVVGYLVLGEWFFGWWTHHAFSFDRQLFVWLVANAAVLGLSTSFEVFLLSTNRHKAYALVFFAETAVALGAGWWLLPALGPVALPITATLLGLVPVAYCLVWLRRSALTLAAVRLPKIES